MYCTSITSDPTFNSFSLKALTGALVGHESWDNVVNVAPKMALVLNSATESSNNGFKRMSTNVSSSKSTMRRKKRDVQAIDVYKSKPHAMIQRLAATTTKSAVRYSKIDMYGFSPIVEPQDDEVMPLVGAAPADKHLSRYLFM